MNRLNATYNQSLQLMLILINIFATLTLTTYLLLNKIILINKLEQQLIINYQIFSMSEDNQKNDAIDQVLDKKATFVVEKQYDQRLKVKYLEFMHEQSLNRYKQKGFNQIQQFFRYRDDRKNHKFTIQATAAQKTCQILNLFVNYRQYSLLLYVLNVKGISKSHRSYSVFQGNFSKVFKVKHSDGKCYAVKCFHINENNFENVFESAVKEYFLYFFASLLKAVPVVGAFPFFELIVYDDCIEFFMEFGNHSLKDISVVQKDLIESLKHLHALNLVHCDIKPENICYSQKHQKHVFLDFGFSELIQQELGQKTMTNYKGTLQFCSTEMVNCFYQKVSKNVDLYYNDIWALKKSIEEIHKKKQREKQKLESVESAIHFDRLLLNFERAEQQNSIDFVYQIGEDLQFLLIELKYMFYLSTYTRILMYHMDIDVMGKLILPKYQPVRGQISQEIQGFYSKFIPIPAFVKYSFGEQRLIRYKNQKLRLQNLFSSIPTFYNKLQAPIQQQTHYFTRYHDKIGRFNRNLLLQPINTKLPKQDQENNSQLQLIETSHDIGFENVNISSKRKIQLASAFLLKHNLIFDQNNRKNYKTAVSYIFDYYCLEDPFTQNKKVLLLNLIITAIILELRERKQFLDMLETILQSQSDNLFKFKFILKFLIALRWLDQIVNINYYELFMLETVNILDRFCQSFSTEVKWQANLRVYLKKIVTYIKKPDISFEQRQRLFSDGLEPTLFKQSSELIWLKAEYDDFCFSSFYCNAECLQLQQFLDCFVEIHKSSFLKASAHRICYSEYYNFELTRYFLAQRQIKLAIILNNRLLNSTSSLAEIVFKTDIDIEMQTINLLESKQSSIKQLSTKLEICLVNSQNCNRLFLYYIFSKILLLHAQSANENIQSKITRYKYQKQCLKLIREYLESKDYLLDIKQTLVFKNFQHSLPRMVYQLSIIVEASFRLDRWQKMQQCEQINQQVRKLVEIIECEGCKRHALLYLLKIQNNKYLLEKNTDKLMKDYTPKLMEQLREDKMQQKCILRLQQVFFNIMKINIQVNNTAANKQMMVRFSSKYSKRKQQNYLSFLQTDKKPVLECIFDSCYEDKNIMFFFLIVLKIIVIFGYSTPHKIQIDSFVAIVNLLIKKMRSKGFYDHQIYAIIKLYAFDQIAQRAYSIYLPLLQITIYYHCGLAQMQYMKQILKVMNRLSYCDYYTKNVVEIKYYHKILHNWAQIFNTPPLLSRKYQNFCKVYVKLKQPRLLNIKKFLGRISKKWSGKLTKTYQPKCQKLIVQKLTRMKKNFDDQSKV